MSTHIDLSLPINENTPTYSGDPKAEIIPAGILEKDGWQDHKLVFGNHTSTHIDAPSHMIAGGKNLNDFPIEKFTGRGVYLDCKKGFNLEEVKEANLQEDDIVLFHTGASDLYRQPAYFENYTVLTEELANYLIEKGVKMVGLDTCSADNERSFPIHKILLGHDILIIENLTNLSGLKGKNFRVYALPLNLQIDGAPVRVVAEVV